MTTPILTAWQFTIQSDFERVGAWLTEFYETHYSAQPKPDMRAVVDAHQLYFSFHLNKRTALDITATDYVAGQVQLLTIQRTSAGAPVCIWLCNQLKRQFSLRSAGSQQLDSGATLHLWTFESSPGRAPGRTLGRHPAGARQHGANAWLIAQHLDQGKSLATLREGWLKRRQAEGLSLPANIEGSMRTVIREERNRRRRK